MPETPNPKPPAQKSRTSLRELEKRFSSPAMAESQPVKLSTEAKVDEESEEEHEHEDNTAQDATASTSGTVDQPTKKKKKRSKRAKIAAALTGQKAEADPSKPAASMDKKAMDQLLEMNPALKGELSGMSPSQAQELLQKMDVSQLLTGLSINNKNQKDMASYKFWQTQPVPRFDERTDPATQPDGPIKEVIPEKVPREPSPLPEGYEWCELDLTQPSEIKEVYTLLSLHYVEDDNAMFRFNYSEAFLNWALKSPDWKKSWHIGVRAKGPSRLLVATIFGIPTKLRVRKNSLDVVEINFLCIHKKLRSKRLTPVLIKEITRRCHLEGVYQAIYTAGVVLPTPVGSCRYFHRSLDWLTLYEVGFSPLPPRMTAAKMIEKNALPAQTKTKGWREMQASDTTQVLDLLSRYLQRFDMAQEFTLAEIEHWFLGRHKQGEGEQVVWSFVVEDPDSQKITDMVSFYCLESSVIGEMSKKHPKIRAAYSFYYASEHAFHKGEEGFKERLRELMSDGLIEAKKAKFDVFNALTLHDNPLFLESLKFGAGDGQLHYYLYNWRTPPMKGGVNKQNMPDESARGGIGMVLL